MWVRAGVRVSFRFGESDDDDDDDDVDDDDGDDYGDGDGQRLLLREAMDAVCCDMLAMERGDVEGNWDLAEVEVVEVQVEVEGRWRR